MLGWRIYRKVGLVLNIALLWLMTVVTAQAANFGTEITGVATLSYTTATGRVEVPTNIVKVRIVPPQVDPAISFFRFDPVNPEQQTPINGSDYSPSGDLAGPFAPVDPQELLNNQIDISQPVPVTRSDRLVKGEVVFVSIDYVTGNADSTVAETLTFRVFTDEGDSDVFRLYESGPDTGVFWTYIPTKANQPTPNDGTVDVDTGTMVQAEFEDNSRRVVTASSAVTIVPENRVFDSLSGTRIDGARIFVRDAVSGQIAAILGRDEISDFPNPVLSGQTVSDTSSQSYPVGAGGFVIPFLPPGRYRLDVEAPPGYSFGSLMTETMIQSVLGQSFVVSDASYGDVFEVTTGGPLRFDIPLDPQTDFSLEFEADRLAADVGDAVVFTASINNLGTQSIPALIETVLPEGFRLIAGSVQIDDITIPDPVVDRNGRSFSTDLGLVAPGSQLKLTFGAKIGPDAKLGETRASALLRSGGGQSLSNRAYALVSLREDLFRSKATIIGRIAENACNPYAPWARTTSRGQGVEGVRLYLETGAYVVSDQDGQFNFQGVNPGTHVVQVDRQTLPEGYDLVSCVENTRFAGRAGSQFVDVKGGGLWRANFYLQKRYGAQALEATAEAGTRMSDERRFDNAWLATQDDQPTWVYPDTSRTPSKPSVNIGIKHPVGARVSLSVNGRPVNPTNLVARDTDVLRRVMISRFKGVDILPGHNRLVAVVTDAQGTTLKTLTQTIAYVDEIARARAIPDASTLLADGRTAPVLALRLEDTAGRGVHAGREAKVRIPAPYQLQSAARNDRFGSQGIEDVDRLGGDERLFVEEDGLLRLTLEPTLHTGRVTVDVILDNGRIEQVPFYIRPEQRDWIVVGLAEALVEASSLRENIVGLAGVTSQGPTSSTDFGANGRVALFAKGMVRGDWLMTLSVDTDRVRGAQDGDFLTEIDPNAYYTLYGDASYQDFDGTSRYPLYLKLEKGAAFALFGDFETGLQEGKLSLYNRRLSGFKAEHLGETFQLTAFAAETNQGFAKDEFAADGTSGPYQLTNTNILAQSETVIVETRDRVRADIVLERRTLTRYRDYTLDYLTGRLIFNFPVNISDAEFNPNVIIVDYETSAETERNLTVGGRLQATLLGDRLRIGTNLISEGGSALAAGSLKRLAAVDALVQINDGTQLRVEYAISDDEATPGSADAKLVELTHTSRGLSGEAYYREEQAGFGLGQTNSNTNSIRRYGLRGSVQLSEYTTQDAARRATRTLDAAIYREENLSNGSSRDAGEVTVTQSTARLTISAGLRAARDKLAGVGAGVRQSVLALVRANYSIPRLGINLIASREQPVSGNDTVSDLPQRTIVGLDKQLGTYATLNVRHEFFKSGQTNGSNTALGLTVRPWSGAMITAASDLVDDASSRRLGGTLSLDQELQLAERWAASAGVRSRRIFARSMGVMDDFIQVAPDAAVSLLETNEDFGAAYAGLSYRDDMMVASVRGEMRQSESEDSYILTASVARDLNDQLSMAGTSRAAWLNPAQGDGREQIDVRLAFAWRPEGGRLAILNRTDFGHLSDGPQGTRTKWVNNLAANALLGDRAEISLNHGIKLVREDLNFGQHKAVVNLLGLETRYDISPTLDFGFAGSVLLDDDGNQSWSYGPSFGLTPADNMWLSVGYNLEGFDDSDFADAEMRREGLFMKLRMKFDEQTLSGLLRHISPASPDSFAPRNTPFARQFEYAY